ncbi:hypothetical protein AMEX_G20689 [Astyanax mexicanus]|uniref:Uncharacterized protein n=1 Tax=Astyanax mexicanus TaxID=7994 RepID=A0A8T2L4R9_ASTMX|nr:hypothetical protein AMEX_G20689 [Astyanax mexicanus]
MKTQENFPNPHNLKNVEISQMSWACAVFNTSVLKALIPLTLNISQPLSTTATLPSPTTHDHTSAESTVLLQSSRNTNDTRWTTTGNTPPPRNTTRTVLISICTSFFFTLILVLGAVCWRTWRRKNLEEECPQCERESVTYAEMSFRQRSERRKEGEKLSVSESVTYAEVSFRQRADNASSDHESVSNIAPEEKVEVLYSTVNLKTKIEN